MLFKLAQFEANIFNNMKWVKQEADHTSEFVNLWRKEYQIIKKQIGVGREEKKPIHWLESVSDSRTTFQTFTKLDK
jgi:hypothetical protein